MLEDDEVIGFNKFPGFVFIAAVVARRAFNGEEGGFLPVGVGADSFRGGL